MPYVCNGRIDGFRSLLECQKQKGCYKIHHCWCNHNYIRTWEHFIFLHIQATMTEEELQRDYERSVIRTSDGRPAISFISWCHYQGINAYEHV
jgi:hypothetical protein